MMPSPWYEDSLDPGKLSQLSISLDAYASGVRVEIPFLAIRGFTPGPNVIVLAGVHGDEYEGPAALHDVARALDPELVSGTVTLAPVVNPPAFLAGTRRNPSDYGDLNRLFPGDPEGSVSARMAALIFEKLIVGHNAVLSLHGWSREATVMPYGEYALDESRSGRDSKACAFALGFSHLHPYHWPAGVMGNSALARGIAVVETEIGGMGTITPDGQLQSNELIYRFLDFWKAYPLPEPWRSKPCPIAVEVQHADIFAHCAGLFRCSLKIGDAVTRGQSVATIYALSGQILEQLHAPCAGRIAILRTFASVQPGDRLIQVFSPLI